MVSRPRREFSWSLARWRLFLYCHRAYYFHYHASWMGWEVARAGEKAALAYQLKKALPVRDLAFEVFVETVRGWWVDNRMDTWKGKCPYGLVSEALRVGIRRLEEVPALEVARGVATPDEAARGFAVELKELAADVAKSPVADILSSVQPIAMVARGRREPFLLDGLKVWASPLAIWRDDGTVKVLNFFRGDVEPEHVVLKNSVDAIYAEKTAKTAISGVSIDSMGVVLGSNGGIVADRLGEPETRALIANSAKEMLSLTSLETDVRESLFAPSGHPEKCDGCRFMPLCEPT